MPRHLIIGPGPCIFEILKYRLFLEYVCVGKQELGLVSDPSSKGHEIPPLSSIYTALRASFCNAPRQMCQVSSSYSLLLPCHCLRVMHSISCYHVHFICIHVCLIHPSIFPVVRFAIRRSYVLRCPFLLFFVCGC